MRHASTVAALVTLALATPAIGIVVVDPSQYITRPEHALVGRLVGGSCVPIGARYALTANHVAVNTRSRISLDGLSYHVKRVIPHPNAPSVDLKIIEIDGPPYFDDWVPLHPAPTTIPIHSLVYIGGTGDETAAPSGDCIAWGGRAEHWATNEIEGMLNATVPYVWYRFDTQMPHEGIAAVYDSGSPLLVMDPDQCHMYLVGIATSATTASGPSCDGHTAYYVVLDDPWLEQFTGPACRGDLDRDGDTDLFDFTALLNDVNGTSLDCATRSRGDLNDDGVVDITDFGVLFVDFGCSP